MTTRLLLLSIAAAALAQSASFAQTQTSSGSPPRGLIGLVLPEPAPDDGFRIVGSVVPKSPAEQRGITEGDYILSVDGQSTDAVRTVDELRKLLRGEPGASVTLQLRKARSGRLEMVVITRADADVLIPWGSPLPREFVQPWRRIEIGMIQQQVHAFVGKPNSTNFEQRRDFWLFPGPSRPLEFFTVGYDVDGRVISIGGSPLFTER